jgi:hypothetical protein
MSLAAYLARQTAPFRRMVQPCWVCHIFQEEIQNDHPTFGSFFPECQAMKNTCARL